MGLAIAELLLRVWGLIIEPGIELLQYYPTQVCETRKHSWHSWSNQVASLCHCSRGVARGGAHGAQAPPFYLRLYTKCI